MTPTPDAETASPPLGADGHYRAIFEAVGDGLEVWDLESGRLLDVNPAHCLS